MADNQYRVETVEASTLIYLSPEEVYESLVDFQQFDKYSKYVTDISRQGDGTPGTEYDITFSWWKITHTARSEVTDVDPPNRIDWELAKSLDAHGYWEVEHVPEEAPDGRPDASRVWFHVDFDPNSADEDSLNIPGFVPLDRIIDRVKPKIETVARRVIQRMVTDLEGEERSVELNVHKTPVSV